MSPARDQRFVRMRRQVREIKAQLDGAVRANLDGMQVWVLQRELRALRVDLTAMGVNIVRHDL